MDTWTLEHWVVEMTLGHYEPPLIWTWLIILLPDWLILGIVHARNGGGKGPKLDHHLFDGFSFSGDAANATPMQSQPVILRFSHPFRLFLRLALLFTVLDSIYSSD